MIINKDLILLIYMDVLQANQNIQIEKISFKLTKKCIKYKNRKLNLKKKKILKVIILRLKNKN